MAKAWDGWRISGDEGRYLGKVLGEKPAGWIIRRALFSEELSVGRPRAQTGSIQQSILCGGNVYVSGPLRIRIEGAGGWARGCVGRGARDWDVCGRRTVTRRRKEGRCRQTRRRKRRTGALTWVILINFRRSFTAAAKWAISVQCKYGVWGGGEGGRGVAAGTSISENSYVRVCRPAGFRVGGGQEAAGRLAVPLRPIYRAGRSWGWGGVHWAMLQCPPGSKAFPAWAVEGDGGAGAL